MQHTFLKYSQCDHYINRVDYKSHNINSNAKNIMHCLYYFQKLFQNPENRSLVISCLYIYGSIS